MKNKKQVLMVCSVFVVFCILTYFFPYSNDDWAWGGSVGLERLSIFFANYNGRYLGNLLVILLTRSNIVKTLFMSLVYTGIVFTIKNIVNKKDNKIVYICTALIFLMDKVLLRQTIVNTSGFTNYTVSILLVLIYLNHIKNIQEKNDKDKWYISALFFLIGFSATLFMEHVTTYLLALNVFVLIYSKVKYKKITLTSWLFFAGTLIGSIVMFTNGAYLNVLNNTDFYREVVTKDSLFVTAGKNYFTKLQNNMISNHLFINACIALLTILLTSKYYNKKIKTVKHKKLVNVLEIIIVGYNLFLIFGNMFNMPVVVGTVYYAIGGFTFVYCVSILLLVFFCVKEKDVRNKLIFYLVSIVIMAAPLLVLSPVTPRCSLPMYIMLVLFTVELYNYILDEKYKNLVGKIFVCLAISILLSLLYIYHNIYICNNERYRRIENQVSRGLTIVYISKNGYEDYVWKNYPVDPTWAKRFMDFNGFDNTIKVIVTEKNDIRYKLVNNKDYKYKNLMIVAHPDDELIWGGAELINEDYLVVCITCGSSKRREKEFEKVLKVTKDEHVSLGYIDTIEGVKLEWEKEYNSIENDLFNIIKSKDWNKIVTHNPEGEYGHIQHKMTNQMVSKIADTSKLYYFSKYRSKKYLEDNNVIPTLSDEITNEKLSIFRENYITQLNIKFLHMFGYENIIQADDWKFYK